MKIENIAFVSCSSSDNETLLEKSLTSNLKCDSYLYKDNTDSIASRYNHFIDQNISYYDDDTAIVFVHDDVHINCTNLYDRLNTAFKKYDVIGVAGSLNAEIKKPCLWHLMGDRASHRGAVAHPINRDGSLEPYYITSFGPMPSRALLIDGVFIATKPSVLQKVRFDTSNPSRFHYYDLDFSLECNRNEFKIGICDIPIVHMSPGLTSPDEEWQKGQEWFIDKWS